MAGRVEQELVVDNLTAQQFTYTGIAAQNPPLDGSGLVMASNYLGIGSAVPTLGRLSLAPYFTGFGGTIDALGISTTVAAGGGGIARVGIFNAIRRPLGNTVLTMSPGSVFFDPGVTIDTTVAPTNLFITGLNLRLPPNKFLWLAAVCSIAAPTLRVPSSVSNMLGYNSALSGPAVCQILNGQNAAIPFFDLSSSIFNGPSNAVGDGTLVCLRYSA